MYLNKAKQTQQEIAELVYKRLNQLKNTGDTCNSPSDPGNYVTHAGESPET